MQDERQTGFTLIELMVTLLVAAVLLGLAVPNFRELIEKSRLRGATDDLVTLLNISRANAVKLGLDVNTSVIITSATSWCAGAVSAVDPDADSSTIGKLAGTAAACDCTTANKCLIGGIANQSSTSSGINSLVSSTNYSGVTLASAASTNSLLNSNGGVVFNSRYGALDFGTLASLSDLTLTSSSGKFSTRISLSALGQSYACTPSTTRFVSGYTQCP